MAEQLITEKQALQIAVSLLSKEKTTGDYGHAALIESRKQLEARVFILEEEENTKNPPRKRPYCCAPATPEVYDKFYPKFWRQALSVDRKKNK